jgi:hypothetical protein
MKQIIDDKSKQHLSSSDDQVDYELLKQAILYIDQQSKQSNNDAHLLSFFILYHLQLSSSPYDPWLGMNTKELQELMHSLTNLSIDMLPKKVNNTIHFSDDQLALLQGSTVLSKYM